MSVLDRLILGPAPCHRCGVWVGWNGYIWREISGRRHDCGAYNRDSIGAVGVGRNPPPRPDAKPRVAP